MGHCNYPFECCNVSITTDTTIAPLSEMLVPENVSPAGLVDQLPDFMGYLAPNLQNKCVRSWKPGVQVFKLFTDSESVVSKLSKDV